MDLGATVCTRRCPRCAECPVAGDCVARATSRQDALPAPRPRKALPHRTVRVLLIERARTILLERRPATGIWGGLWSLPEVASRRGRRRALPSALRRDGLVAGDALPAIEHGFTHYRLTMLPQRLAVKSWPAAREALGSPFHARGRHRRRAAGADPKLLRSI
jgi:A/G-specific adenine glycosylase